LPYSSLITRTDVAALIPEDVASQVIGHVAEQSATLERFRHVPISSAQMRVPVLSALPVAYFVQGDTGLKQTTELAWANKFLNVEEIACIVPIPEAVLDDINFDIWDSVRPLMAEAIGRTLDAAVFFGTNKPASWPTDVVAAATAAGNSTTGGALPEAGGIAQDINSVMSLVEADGFAVDGFVTSTAMKGVLRGARGTDGQPLADVSASTLYGLPISYVMRGLWPTGVGAVRLIAGDWSQFVVAVRKDITYKLLTEAVIQDNTGVIVYNLAQQDMVALRVVFRAAWQVANPMTWDQPTEANRYPAATLKNA
jgi:HK97 family phage major capsid protein